QESLPSLGFMELNVFNNVSKALEWFKLGVEANSDVSCLIGQFDAHVRVGSSAKALKILTNLRGLKDKLERIIAKGMDNVPPSYRDLAASNQVLLSTFFCNTIRCY
ncbi:hypothetical protein OXX69_012475, partial [Metschnikowia pulcherrima]